MARRFRNTSAEYLLTPDITAQSGATRWTVAGWMYHEIQSYTSGGFIYQQASGSTMQFFWDTTGKYYRTRWDTSSGANLVDIGETHLRAQRWHLYTCQYDGAQMRVFLDKTLVGTAAATGGLSNNDGFYFARNTPGSVPFNGSLAHWGMWNRVLSPADIYQLADGRPMLELAPNQLYLPMWGTTPELDLSPNSYSITLGGHPPPFADPPQLSAWRVEEPWMVVPPTVGYTLALDAGSYAITGNDATLKAGRKLALDSGVYTVTGNDAILKVARKLALDAGSYTLTGLDATLTYTPTGGPTYTLALDAGSYAITGNDVSLIVNRVMALDSGVYTVTGNDASLIVHRILAAEAGSYTLTGNDPLLTISRKLALDAGSYAISGQTVTLVYSGALIPDVPIDRIYIVQAEDRIYVIPAENRVYPVH